MGIAFLAVVSLQSHDGAVAVANMSLAAKTVSAGVVQSCGLAFEALFSSWTRLSMHGVSLSILARAHIGDMELYGVSSS